MMNIWREKVPLRFACIDRSNRLTLWSIFNFFQEAAISHATVLGAGRDALASSGQAWILSRFSIFVDRRPVYGQTVQVSSWPRGWEKLFAMRDYDIRDEEDKVLVRGRAAWLVLDVEKRRPLRSQSLKAELPTNDGIDAFPAGPVALGARENLAKAGSRTANYSDIDYYGHANNARYIQWIQDVTDMEIFTKASQIRFDINYLNEVLPGETVELWTETIDIAADMAAEESEYKGDYPKQAAHVLAYEGRKSASDQVAFRAELRTGL